MIIAFDIGGTKTASALVSAEGALSHVGQIPTSQAGPEAGFAELAELTERCLAAAENKGEKVTGIGISLAAALETDTDRILWAPNINGWRNVDLKKYLEERFHVPVFLEYDGHAAVLGEAWQGAGKGCASVLDVIIGTGVGAGAIIDGHLIRGRNRLAGAMGWQVLSLDPGADQLNSEKLGYWESLTAGPGIARYAQKVLREEDAVRIAGSREALDAKKLFDAAREGDAAALAVARTIAKWIGLGVGNAISMLNPEVVVLGGNVGHACGFLLDTIRTEAARFAQPISAGNVAFRVSELGTEAGLYGAAYAVILRSGARPSF